MPSATALRARSGRIIARWTTSLLVVAGLTTGGGVPVARPAEAPDAPTIETLEARSPSDLFVEWTEPPQHEDPAYGVLVQVYKDDQFMTGWFERGPSDRSSRRHVYSDEDGILQASTEYCVGLTSYIGTGDKETSVFSAESERRCTTTPAVRAKHPDLGPIPTPADLVVEGIKGREEREWSTVRNQSPAYLVVIRNDGPDALKTVVVDISASGVLTMAEQAPVLRQGWEAAGFTCVSTPASGGANSGLRCTGGTLKQGEKINPAVAVRATRQGFGAIHVTVSVSGGTPELDTKDNTLALPVRIY